MIKQEMAFHDQLWSPADRTTEFNSRARMRSDFAAVNTVGALAVASFWHTPGSQMITQFNPPAHLPSIRSQFLNHSSRSATVVLLPSLGLPHGNQKEPQHSKAGVLPCLGLPHFFKRH
ncbi:hypothetical protein NQZ68_014345 [Dissostichus eleginoides]|nr:hypothetical protein NQZ68_014345 [Dissostichus eleginoides]